MKVQHIGAGGAPFIAFALGVFVIGPVPRPHSAAQDVTPPAAQTAEQPTTDEDYRMGPGDLIAVRVFGVDQLEHASRVSNSGKIRLPMLGLLDVVNQTTGELSARIAATLREKGLIKDPSVQVRVKEYRWQPVYILGEVIQPGQFMIKNQMYLLDLIALASGMNRVASPVGYLYRRKPSKPASADVANGQPRPVEGQTEGMEEAIPIDFAALNSGQDPNLNLKLRGGDVLYVPERTKEFFYVVGDVSQAGPYELRSEQPVMLTQGVAMAGGPRKTAKLSACVLVRVDEQGVREERPFDYKAVLEGRSPDILVATNDIIFIPGSTAKTLAYGLLNMIPNVATGAAQPR